MDLTGCSMRKKMQKLMKKLRQKLINSSNIFMKKKKNKEYIKGVYLHHLLDFFKETHIDIHDVDLVFDRYLQDKVVCEISNSEGVVINFQDEINDVFRVIRENKEELYKDLIG